VNFTAEEHLSDTSIRALSRLIGKSVSFWSSDVEINPDFVQIDDLSICLAPDDFICLSWDWYDTEICAVDVFTLLVEETKKPKNISYGKSGGAHTFRSGSQIHTSLPNSVQRIHVIECMDEDEVIDGEKKGHVDRVCFDGALIFEMKEPPALSVGCEGSIAGRMPITFIPGWRMREHLRERRVRLTLDAVIQ
jgi:hypothetical protein